MADLVVVPIGFLTEHKEVIYDLDVEVGRLCEELGINMVRAATVGNHPRLVRMIRELVVERIDPSAPRLALGSDGPWARSVPGGLLPHGVNTHLFISEALVKSCESSLKVLTRRPRPARPGVANAAVAAIAHEKVVVIGHQHKGVQPPPVGFDDPPEPIEPALAVRLVADNRASLVAPRHDVVQRQESRSAVVWPLAEVYVVFSTSAKPIGPQSACTPESPGRSRI